MSPCSLEAQQPARQRAGSPHPHDFGELEAPMHTRAAFRGHCLLSDASALPEALRAINVWRCLGLSASPSCPRWPKLCYLGAFPLCPCPPSRPKMERKWKCKPGEANAVSQLPVCRFPHTFLSLERKVVCTGHTSILPANLRCRSGPLSTVSHLLT